MRTYISFVDFMGQVRPGDRGTDVWVYNPNEPGTLAEQTMEWLESRSYMNQYGTTLHVVQDTEILAQDERYFRLSWTTRGGNIARGYRTLYRYLTPEEVIDGYLCRKDPLYGTTVYFE